jgi:hypothetical protein
MVAAREAGSPRIASVYVLRPERVQILDLARSILELQGD